MFKFSEENQNIINSILKKYPQDRKKSAILPLLDLAQRQQNGFLSKEAIETVASIIEVSNIHAYEVASFYSMFNLKPVGKFHIQICGTTPCWLRGAGDLINHCKKKLSIKTGETTSDGLFTLTEVECLGACVNAPVVQVNDDYYEDLTIDKIDQLLDNFRLSK